MMHLPKILTDKPKKITRDEARKLVRESSDEAIALHKSFRDGTWKPKDIVDIVGRNCGE